MLPPSNLEALLRLLFESEGPLSLEVPYALDGEARAFRVVLEEAHVQEILTAVRRAANSQALALGGRPPFPDPLALPDPDDALRRATRAALADLLASLDGVDDLDARLRALKEAKGLLAQLKPSVSVKQAEWDRIVRAVRKLNPALSEDDVLALF